MSVLKTATVLFFITTVTVTSACPISECSCFPSNANPSLQVIDCRSKGFTEIPEIVVSTVPEAYYELTLRGNSITSIPNGAFSNLTLNVLDLSNNKLEQISNNAFQGLESSLTTLKLGGDRQAINPVALSYTFLNGLVELLELDLRYFRLTTIDENTFPTLAKLSDLTLRSMKIQNILSSGFQNKFPVLQNLELIGNVELGNIPVTALRFLTTLNHLSLQQNNISIVAFASFETMTNLINLDLSHNEILRLEDDCFRGLYSKLEYLSLSLNRLDQNRLRPIYTNSWTSLEQLNIGLNSLTDIPSGFFTNMPNLAYINLNNNKLTSIKTTYFTDLPRIHILDLNYNPITTIEDRSFSQLTTLKQLEMEHFSNGNNPAQRLNLTTATVQGLEHTLEILNLLQTKVVEEEAWKAIKALKRLTTLTMQNSGLTAIQDFVFSDHSHLSYLDLSNNQITEVRQATFHGLNNVLGTLNMQYNRITSIDECVLKDFNVLLLLYLNNNPTHCNCTMKWLKDLNDNPLPNSLINEVACASPANLANRMLFSLTDQELGCAGYVPPTCPDFSVTTTPAPPPTTTPAPTLPLPDLSSIITSTTETSITISWSSVDLRLVSGFKISYTTSGVTQETQPLATDATLYTISSLTPETFYRVCVHAILTDPSRAPVESCHDPTTLVAVPELTVGIASTTTTSVQMTWIINSSPLITGFDLTYYKFGTSVNQGPIPIDSTRREFTINGLEPDNKYELCLEVRLTVSRTVIKCETANTKVVQVTPPSDAANTGPNAGVIAGAVVGCILAVVIIVAILYILFIRKGSPKQPLPPIQQTSFSTAGFPTTDHARRFVKSKPAQNGGGKDIQVISTGKMDPEDSSRISGGSYQFLNEGRVTLQPAPFNKMSGANGSSQDFIPPGKHKYQNVGYNNSPNPPSKSDHSYINTQQPQKGSVYTNDIDKRPLPTEPHRDEFGFTNKGFKPEAPATSPKSPTSPNVYHEIPI